MKKEVILVIVLENGVINSEQTKTFDDSTDADYYASETIKNVSSYHKVCMTDEEIEMCLDDGYWMLESVPTKLKIELFITCITHCYNN